jgi:hypothetical protein
MCELKYARGGQGGGSTIGRHEGKQGAAKGTGEAKTEGGARKYTQDSDDPTAREGGTETGMEEKNMRNRRRRQEDQQEYRDDREQRADKQKC